MTLFPLILASASQVRACLLQQAGVVFTIQPADIDENECKAAYVAEGKLPEDLAPFLAQQKARAVGLQHPQGWVIGCDQILRHGGKIYNKPQNLSDARQHLQQLRGSTHILSTACCLVHNHEVVWQHVEIARMTMWSFSDVFLERYLADAGEAVLTSVGGYQLESVGAQLFEHIEGDYFAILGVPLIPLLAALRTCGVVC